MNETINLINNRISLRKYDNRQISQEDLDIVLNSAMRAPTAGNCMMYSIIVIKDEEKKKKLSKTCDNQPFIATAPVILIFVADAHRQEKFFEASGVKEYCKDRNEEMITPDRGQLFLAAGDAFIAAQNAVVAAESMGIGSCYIGDIVENYEIHKEMLKLPNWAIPVSMLCLGYYPENYPRRVASRFDKKYIVFDEEYSSLQKKDYADMYKKFEAKVPNPNKYDAENYGQHLYGRKFGNEFMKEMDRSLKAAIEHWLTKVDE